MLFRGSEWRRRFRGVQANVCGARRDSTRRKERLKSLSAVGTVPYATMQFSIGFYSWDVPLYSRFRLRSRCTQRLYMILRFGDVEHWRRSGGRLGDPCPKFKLCKTSTATFARQPEAGGWENIRYPRYKGSKIEQMTSGLTEEDRAANGPKHNDPWLSAPLMSRR